MTTPNGVLNAVCTSAFDDSVLSYQLGHLVGMTWQDLSLDGSSTQFSSDVWIWESQTSTVTGNLTITAPAISGWNFPASEAAVVGATSAAATSAAAASSTGESGSGTATGGDGANAYRSATIALVVICGLSTVAAIVFSALYFALRRRLGPSRPGDVAVPIADAADKAELGSNSPSPGTILNTTGTPDHGAPQWRQGYTYPHKLNQSQYDYAEAERTRIMHHRAQV